MTSATGDPTSAFGRPARRARRRGGFTMVEVMVVVAILSLLFTIILVATAGYRTTAAVRATESLIQRLDLAIGKYYDLTGSFPPDGFDSDIENEEGVPIYGSACLHHFLSRPVTVTRNIAGEVRRSQEPPVMEFGGRDIAEDPGTPGVFEIVDGFGTPIHYDNTENRVFDAQTGQAHMPPALTHPPDPRESTDHKAVARTGIQRIGFDLWSHGELGHKEPPSPADLSKTIATWNQGVGQQAYDEE